MSNLKLLDCTLRDGGYVNDWEFGRDNIVNIFERLVSAGVDVMEVGFLDERRPFDKNRSIFPDTDSAGRIYGGLDRGRTKVVAMIDFGTCGLEHIKPRSESCLDGIRVIFKKAKKEKAMEFCRELVALGYEVFAQAVSITSYSDRELLDLVDLANDIRPAALSLVDTYGLMHEDHVLHYFELLNYNLRPEIAIGYHAHNNFQLAYSNSIQVLSVPTNRTVIVDGSLYGMGKSAGNLPIELISMYMNSNFGKHYDTHQLLEAIDINIMPFYRKSPWGYKLFFYIAASNQCHPNYVQYLMSKGTLSLSSINEILARLEGEKKLLYDKDYIEELYREYQSHECNDEEDMKRLSELFKGRDLLLIGPGKTVKQEADRIRAYIGEHHPLVIAVNYIPEEPDPDYVFLSNSRRYVQLNTRLVEYQAAGGKVGIIATSNVNDVSGTFDYNLNYSSLIDREAEIIDNSFVMLLRILARTGVKKAAAAGFDGYRVDGKNYFDSAMDYRLEVEKTLRINDYVKEVLSGLRGSLDVNFITETRYTES